MPNHIVFYCILFSCFLGLGQELRTISGTVKGDRDKAPLANSIVFLEGTQISTKTSKDGSFSISSDTSGDFILHISHADFSVHRMPVSVHSTAIDLGEIYLTKDVATEQTDNLITLTDAELLEDEFSANPSALLQATRDVFLNKAAFDFGQAFFRVRGYDAQEGKVLLNGISMNNFFDGRPQWNNWGGLNDVTRNQQFARALQPSEYSFGGILGTTNIDTRPSAMRAGTRLSSSASNRTYAGRLMVTHTSNSQNNGFAYSLSASRRWAKQGYIDGTLYDAFSVFAAISYNFNSSNTLYFTSILASNRRGRSAALTAELFELAGKTYNPYWGIQNGNIRNSRERKISEPILMLNHRYETKTLRVNTGISYQFGTSARSRLAYYNAPNPDPSYYRYLPSFYVNSPIGANFISANMAREGFVQNPQLNWGQVYLANTTDKAAYVLSEDVTNRQQFSVNSIANLKLSDAFKLDFGLSYQNVNATNFARINDLFGANFHEDIDPFSNSKNDINGTLRKEEGNIFGYQYALEASKFEAFTQFQLSLQKVEAFISGSYANSGYQRDGLFQNERFLNDSFGKSKQVSFANFGGKGGLAYKLNNRHHISANAAFFNRAPVVQNAFVNPRENNQIVPGLRSEQVNSLDVNYYLRLPQLTGRITGYHTTFQQGTDVNFFFVDSGLGSDFVQEVITDLDKRHVGVELGLEYQLSSAVQLTAAAAVGRFVYANNPSVAINFDTADAAENLINTSGQVDLGKATIKNYKLAQGPQKAVALGISYRDPKYWWLSATTNYLADNYANIAAITRTESFYLDPETGLPFPEATEENVAKLLGQKPLDDFYLLNLVGGKSWLKKGKYISIFASVNNVFDTVFRTGGYEQSRNGNFGTLQQDNLSGTPSHAPKYWYGYGRTYFLNMAFSF